MKRFILIMILLWVRISLSPAQDIILDGCGATFPAPLYQTWIEKYREQTNVRINYKPHGSGAGVEHLLDGTVDFGATDVFMTNENLENAPDTIIHIPTCIGAVVLIYNLPGNPELLFSPDLLAGIFLGTINNWSDRRIMQLNPGVKLPDVEITVVHRADGSGTSHIFTEYLSKVSRDWSKRVGTGKIVKWPAGIGVDGNTKVAEFVKRINGSIGYVEMTYAERNNFPKASIQNASGNFIKPTLESVTTAAKTRLPNDLRISLTNTHARYGYPICSFTYIITYEQARLGPPEKSKAIADFLWWAIHDGQLYTKPLFYAPLPDGAIVNAENIIKKIR